MEFCRELKFEETPDYEKGIGIWKRCMRRHEFNEKIFDYTWKQNRLSKEKENLKNSLMNLIGKKKTKGAGEGADDEKQQA